MPEFALYDLRKSRLKQVFGGRLSHRLIDLLPSSLLTLFVETNLWCLIKDAEVSDPDAAGEV